MTAKTPIRTVFTAGVATGLAEYQTGEFVSLEHGGLGAALSIGSANQVLKVNSGGTAVEFGTVPITAGTGITITDGEVAVDTSTIATRTYADNAASAAVSNVIDSSPEALNTLNELAAALGDDANFATTITTSIGTKLATADFASTFDTRLATKDTDDLNEGSTNLYHTSARVDDRIALATGANLSLTNKDTDDLSEGATNLYYTDARFDTRLGTKTTTDLSEGDNLYYTNARADARVALATGVNLSLANQDTDDLSEGSTNLYYTDARSRASISVSGSLAYNNSTGVINYVTPTTIASLSNHDTDGLSEGLTNLYYTSARANTDFDTRLGTKTTTNLTEGDNLYYTNARADARVALATGTNLDLTNQDTDDLSEGSTNLYYTDARANSAFDTRLGTKDTDNLTEGSTNLYYTSARANTDFDTRLATKTTTNLTEGDNLYYTDARANSAFDTRLGTKDTDDLSEGSTNLYYTNARADARVAAATGVNLDLSNQDTGDLAEGSNLYYTDARSRAAISVTDSGGDGSLSYNNSTGVVTYTGPSASEVRAHFSGGTGVTITSGEIAIGQAVATNSDVQFNDLVVDGNLTVNGTTVTNSATNTTIEDALIELGSGNTGENSNDLGLILERGTTGDNGFIGFDESSDKFIVGTTTATGSSTGGLTITTGTLIANIEGNVTGNVTGTVSDVSNHDTDDISEGSTNLYYTDARSRAAISVTDSGGDGSLSYNSSTGVVTYTGPSASEVRAHFSAGTGVSITNGEVAIGQAVATNSNVQFNNVQIDGTLDCGVLT